MMIELLLVAIIVIYIFIVNGKICGTAGEKRGSKTVFIRKRAGKTSTAQSIS